MKFPEELGISFLTEAECMVNNPFWKEDIVTSGNSGHTIVWSFGPAELTKF